jgi:hypothetical protein
MALVILGFLPCSGIETNSQRDFGFGAMEIFQLKMTPLISLFEI